MDGFVMQVTENQSRQSREIRFRCYDSAAAFQFDGCLVQKIDRILQVVKHIRERDDIEAFISNGLESINGMTIENVIEVVQDIARDEVWMKSPQR
jgi:hypothetical protein